MDTKEYIIYISIENKCNISLIGSLYACNFVYDI